MASIYLDHNSTTPLLAEAADAMRRTEAEAFGNPASAHHSGRAARRALEDAREQIAALLGAHADEVTFTSGATEANNLAVFSLATGRVAASPIEHPCVIEPLRQLEARGVPVDWWPVDSRGIVAPSPVPADTQLVCVMLVNHETGALQPVQAITRIVSPSTAIHCDAVQAVGKIPVNFRELGVTTLTASAHKFAGPKGVGVLIAKRGTKLRALQYGGHQQQGRRPGTESAPLAVGMATALDVAVRNMTANRARLEALRARLWERLRECCAIVLNGPEIGASDVVLTTLNVSFPGYRADVLLMSLDLAGIACSTGSACSSGSLLPSPVLRAMGIPEEQLRTALRFSFSPTLELADIDEAANRIDSVVRSLRESSKLE